jgi:hypothetical protein
MNYNLFLLWHAKFFPCPSLDLLKLPFNFASHQMLVSNIFCRLNFRNVCSHSVQSIWSSPVKGKVLRHEGVWGSGCIDPAFLDFGISCSWVVSFTPRPLYPWGKSPYSPFGRRLGGPQSRSGRRGEEKILDPTRNQTQTPLSSSLKPVAIPTTLSRLPDQWVY